MVFKFRGNPWIIAQPVGEAGIYMPASLPVATAAASRTLNTSRYTFGGPQGINSRCGGKEKCPDIHYSSVISSNISAAAPQIGQRCGGCFPS